MLSEARGAPGLVRSGAVDRRRLVTLVFLVWTAAAFGRAVVTLPDRLGRTALANAEPLLWRRSSPEVAALERFVAAREELARLGVSVRVVAVAGSGFDASYVWHWAQYLAPRANFLWSGDVDSDYPAELALAWGSVEPAPGWELIARDGALALYRVPR